MTLELSCSALLALKDGVPSDVTADGRADVGAIERELEALGYRVDRWTAVAAPCGPGGDPFGHVGELLGARIVPAQ